MRITVALDGDEAGRKATQAFLEVVSWWGWPRQALEPASQLVAQLEREITRLGMTAEAHLAEPPCEGRDRRIAEVERDLDSVTEYWRGVRGYAESVTNHSRARSAEEYIALEAEAAVPNLRGPSIDYRAIKDRIDIADHIARYTKLRRTGLNLVGRCPLPGHEDSSPSLTVYPATRSFYCFGCRKGGDVIDFASLIGADDLTA